jgi:hypothetical protein
MRRDQFLAFDEVISAASGSTEVYRIMRRDQFLAFDEVISAASGSTEVYTAATLNQRLAAQNQIGLQVVIDNVSGTPAFDLWVEHSADARNWLQQADVSQTFPPTEPAGSGDITFSSGTLVANTSYTRMYSNFFPGFNRPPLGSSGPLLSNVRLAMKLSAGEAHVKVYATLRNP